MKQTEGKVFARDYFYNVYLASLMTARQLRSSNFLTLLGEDFRELDVLSELGVPLYRVYSVERDHSIYERQKTRNKREDRGVALFFGDLSDYIHSYQFSDHRISVFNLDICGSFLGAVDPALGRLLMFARRNPSTVMATYSSVGRDRPQLMEGLKSLVILSWLAPEVTNRLVQHIYSQYRSVNPTEKVSKQEEVSKNQLLRHMFWLRSHMEHIMVGSYQLGFTSADAVSDAMAEQEEAWRSFMSKYPHPLTYEAVVEKVASLPRPTKSGSVRMDMALGEVEMLTYSANDGFYHNCYFATYNTDEETPIPLDSWLVEASASMRRNQILLIDSEGNPYPITQGLRVRSIDEVIMWDRKDLERGLRIVAIPPLTSYEGTSVKETESNEDNELSARTILQIRKLARQNLDSATIRDTLGLQVPIPKIAAQVAVARRTNSN